MLLEFGDIPPKESSRALGKVISALSASTRATDVVGWFKNNSVVGVLFTEIIIDDQSSIVSTMMARVSETLGHSLTLDQFNQVKISFHVFPEPWDGGMFDRPSNAMLYPICTATYSRSKDRLV